jgi:hypothetical protein
MFCKIQKTYKNDELGLIKIRDFKEWRKNSKERKESKTKLLVLQLPNLEYAKIVLIIN